MKIKKLPKTEWDLDLYNTDYYGYGDVDIFTDNSKLIGERVICIFRKKDLDKYNDNTCTDTTFAILCNSCGVKSGIESLLGLDAGQIIPVQFKGEYNPELPLKWIQSSFWTL